MCHKLTNFRIIQKAFIITSLLVSLSFVANAANLVRNLPGFSGELPFELETGYVGVGVNENVQLYYYFVQSQRNPLKDPLIFFHTGGPGSSGLSGIFYEIGPIRFDYKAFNGSLPALTVNPDTLAKEASLIFIDAPVGTGFSYSKTDQDYNIKDDVDAAQANYQFIQKWMLDHPTFLNNPLYIAGGSYAGKIVPIVVHKIFSGLKKREGPKMNLQGYILWNPATDQAIEYSVILPTAHRFGLISDELYESAKVNCGGDINTDMIRSSLCLKDQQAIAQCTDVVWKEHTLEPNCGLQDFILDKTLIGPYVTIDDVLEVFNGKKPWCRKYTYVLSNIWANDPEVQEALRVRKGTKSFWQRVNGTIMGSSYPTGAITSVIDYHQSLIDTGYRALIYSGDHDLSVPYLSTIKWISSLNLTISDPWRPWIVDEQAAGYTRTFNHISNYELTFATVKGAGHIASEYKPKQCYEMVHRWLSHQKL